MKEIGLRNGEEGTFPPDPLIITITPSYYSFNSDIDLDV